MWMNEVSFCSEKSAASYSIDNNLIFLTIIFWILSLVIIVFSPFYFSFTGRTWRYSKKYLMLQLKLRFLPYLFFKSRELI